jgi:hypothetical protein
MWCERGARLVRGILSESLRAALRRRSCDEHFDGQAQIRKLALECMDLAVPGPHFPAQCSFAFVELGVQPLDRRERDAVRAIVVT